MINWIKNRYRLKRLFEDKKLFMNTMVNRGAPMKQLEAIFRFWEVDKGEVERRSAMLKKYGMNQPKSKKQCQKMIEDLKKCQI